MATTTLTPEQDLALATRQVSVAVAAGAGCGKTFVLTERFLSHLDPAGPDAPEPAQLHELVAITFTDAAAREMRSRIRSKCFERLQTAPTAEQEAYWLRLLRALDTARISTIHAFCTSLLRTYAVELGLDPMFGVLDQADADVLQTQMIDDVLRQRLNLRDPTALELAATYGLGQLKQQLRELLKHRHTTSFPRWLGADAQELVAAWRTCYDETVFPAAIGELVDSPPAREIVRLLESVEPQKQAFADTKAALLSLLSKDAAASAAPSHLDDISSLARVQGVCTAQDWPSPDDYKQYQAACTSLRNAVKKCGITPLDDAAARRAAELGLAALTVANDVAERYEHHKETQGKLDFDDLLARAYQLLTDPQHATVRQQVSQGLKLLLVDEFQDTDQLQVDLVLALCGDGFDAGRLFFVGDFKQSIYRFRGAQPEVFSRLRNKVAKPGQLPLTLNFRSQPAILRFVNATFRGEFGDDYDPLRACREQTTPEPAVEFLWTIWPEKNNRQKGSAAAARREEARWIARRLRQLVDSDTPLVADPGSSGGEQNARPLRLGDIAILCRALSDVQHYEEALREYDLDYYLVGGHAFYAQQEIYDVLNLLRAVASTADEVSLAGALRSPFFALADETLFWLVESSGSLNAALRADAPSSQLSPEEQAKAIAAADTIRYLRERKDSLAIAELIAAALARTGYDAVLLAEFLGERKLANLHKLLEQARAADQGGVTELDGFITQLAQFAAEQPKEALAATCPETANVIRLMTIHYAKGLEFPLVVVPDLDRSPIFRLPAAAFDPQIGPLVPLADDEKGPSTVGVDLFRTLEKRADAQERTRLLYVACTRAADYLILSSSLSSYDKPASDWMQLVARRFDLATGRPLATLPNGYDEPLVRVTDREPETEHKPSGRSRGPDLTKMLDKARQQAASNQGVVPVGAAPIAVDHAARQQFSFSRLSGQLVRLDVPRAMSQHDRSEDATWIDPRGLGSLVHAVLERIDFGTEQSLDAWCEQLAAEHVVENVAAAAASAREMIERFATSPRWQALVDAAVVHRELEFLLAWPPGKGDGRYLQGYIDCLYQDQQGGWHVVDYKTNNITAAELAREAERYEMQMYVYAMAVEQATGERPVELALHFLRPGAEHVIPWNDHTRHRGVELVSQAMEQILHPSPEPCTPSPTDS